MNLMTGKKKCAVIGLIFGLLLAAGLVVAGVESYEQVKGEDVPYLPPYPKSVRIEASKSDYGMFKFTAKFDEGDFPVEKVVEGKTYHLKYVLAAPKSQLEILRNYEAAFKSKGWEIVVPVDPERLFLATVTAHKTGAPEIWAQVNCGEAEKDENDVQFVQYEINVVEIAKLDQAIEIKDASALKKELDASGRVAVYGINFDTGKSTIKPDSEKVLKEIGKLLADNPGLKLAIEGHTDNVGDAKANQKLSEDRAAAVKDYLVKNNKIAADRLSTKGLGDTKPIADNKTDDGKAKNRRVELVKI